MTNVKMELKGQELVIKIKLNVKGSPSKSRKSLVLASTHGNVMVPGESGAKIGLTVYKPNA